MEVERGLSALSFLFRRDSQDWVTGGWIRGEGDSQRVGERWGCLVFFLREICKTEWLQQAP